VPTVQSVAGPGGATTTIVPDALLFQFGSSALLPTADGILQPVVTQARRHHLTVSITGYASPDGGTTAYNIALSERRAEAVSQRLHALGLLDDQIIEVTGVGTAGKSPAACLVHGQPDEAVCAQLRRVVITMSPAQAPSVN
jgi:outer membrane protein OmpA-like peptidoglycan-associated protein